MNFDLLFKPNQKVSPQLERWAYIAFAGFVALLWALLPSKLIPSPWAIVSAFPHVWLEEGFGQELWTSVSLNLQADALMILTSLSVAYSTRLPIMRPLATAFAAGRFNSFVGLPFLLTLLIGNEHWIKVDLLAMGMSVFTVPAIIDVIGTIPQESYDDARTLRMGEWRIIWEVVILGKFHDVVDVLRTNLSMGWAFLPMVEGTFRSEGGIGVLLIQENKYFRLDYVYCIAIIVGLVGLLQDRAIFILKSWCCPYSLISTEHR